MKKLHLDNGIIKNIHWIQPYIQEYNMIDEVLALATQLKQVIKENDKQIMEEEFMDYCTVELYWHKISLIKYTSGQIKNSKSCFDNSTWKC